MWTRVDEGRWIIEATDEDPTANYLQRRGDKLHELHVDGVRATLHVYDAGQADDTAPLADARHAFTVELAARARTADVAWKTLEEA